MLKFLEIQVRKITRTGLKNENNTEWYIDKCGLHQRSEVEHWQQHWSEWTEAMKVGRYKGRKIKQTKKFKKRKS